ncbi:SulP family inorganic anion transporter [Yunchengibacter salinarum]|uniref:SulP family inorganic anion transporter n=1 Tax=Yunchengibacter salinarum TaxID=3133399 RepID=UPI0035B68E28
MKLLDFSNLRGDIFGGITVAVVALPLALALGVASGAGPIAGMYGAIIVGFFAALFGGTPTNITGPTGPMVVVFGGLYAAFSGRPDLAFTAVVLAGLIQIAMGAFKVGEYIRLVPYPVISGFMTGIGVIIIILQFGRLLGHEAPPGVLGALGALPAAVADINMGALAVGAVTLAVIFTWPMKWGKYFPAPLAALFAGVLASMVIPGGAPILGDIPSGLPSFHMPMFEADAMTKVIEAAVVLALLGAIDSLLTSLVADNMTRTRHESNRELFGQGIGNTLAGLFGAVPSAGATMRTVVNIRTGGRTNLSGIIHALVLFLIVIALGPLAAKIPHAALAGILVKVGYDIIDWNYLKRAHKGPRLDLILMALVLGITVFVDLITAVAAGVVLAALAFIQQLAKSQLEEIMQARGAMDDPEEIAEVEKSNGRINLFSFGGPLSFGAAADISHRLREEVKYHEKVMVLDFSRVPFMDVSAANAVETIARDAHEAGKWVFLAGTNEKVRAVLAGLGSDHHIPSDGYFDTRLEALKHANKVLAKDDAENGTDPSDGQPAPAT